MRQLSVVLLSKRMDFPYYIWEKGTILGTSTMGFILKHLDQIICSILYLFYMALGLEHFSPNPDNV